MNRKNLSVKNKIHKKITRHLNKKKLFEIFDKFSSSLDIKESFAVAVSGGPDSLALAYLAKCFAIKNKIEAKFFIVDHKLRKESTLESKKTKDCLKKMDIDCKILSWNGKKPSKKIQLLARDKRYSLLSNECKKNKIKNLLLGHHLDDLTENFLIRIVRGSGLNGLVSFSKKTKYKDTNLNILRPLLDLEKKELIYTSKEVFNYFVEDPSNINKDFKRTRIRNLLKSLENEGLDKNKIILTIDNLKDSNKSIKFYVKRNLKDNSTFLKKKNIYVLKSFFFNQSHEVVFRSLTKIIQVLGKKYYPVRGKKVNELIKQINDKSFLKITLGGCIMYKANETILISKEN
jgi:tRNA(Ile)-lysidine synthase